MHLKSTFFFGRANGAREALDLFWRIVLGAQNVLFTRWSDAFPNSAFASKISQTHV